jgi:hypothetical protein
MVYTMVYTMVYIIVSTRLKKKTTLLFSSWETLPSFPSAVELWPPAGWEIGSIVFTVAGSPPNMFTVAVVVFTPDEDAKDLGR